MANKFHSEMITSDGIHTMIAYEFADSTARLAFSPQAFDLGKIVRQTNNNSYFIISNTSPLAYVELTSILPINAKGDLLSHSGAANGKLPVGTNGQVLTADSTQSLGLIWKTLALGAVAQYSNSGSQNTSTTLIPTVDTARENNLAGIFTKVSATQIRTDFSGRCRVLYHVNGFGDTNNRGYNVQIRKNTVAQAWTRQDTLFQNQDPRQSVATGVFPFACAVNDTFSLLITSNESNLCTFPADRIRFAIEAVRVD